MKSLSNRSRLVCRALQGVTSTLDIPKEWAAMQSHTRWQHLHRAIPGGRASPGSGSFSGSLQHQGLAATRGLKLSTWTASSKYCTNHNPSDLHQVGIVDNLNDVLAHWGVNWQPQCLRCLILSQSNSEWQVLAVKGLLDTGWWYDQFISSFY